MRNSHIYAKKENQRNISAHFSTFFTESSDIFRMLSTTCSNVLGSCRNFVFEKNLSAKHISCSSSVSGTKSFTGRFHPFRSITSLVSPVPVCLSHTLAWHITLTWLTLEFKYPVSGCHPGQPHLHRWGWDPVELKAPR